VPQIPNTTWINLRSISQDILQYLDPNYPSPLSGSDMQELMLTHFQSQASEAQLAFVHYLVSNDGSVSLKTLRRLEGIEFVLARDGKSRAPKDLVDPEAPLSRLFPGNSSSLPDTSESHLRTLVDNLRTLKLFINKLSLDILYDRIHFVSSNQSAESEQLAKVLINFVSRLRFDCRHLFDSTLSRDLKWIPTLTGLQSPLSCRDASSHHGKTHLFDEVMPMVNSDVHVGHYLRKAFLWDDEVPFEVISRQLAKVLDCPEPSYRKVRAIVDHLARQTFGGNELFCLRELLRDKKWVPTREGCLVSVPFALLGGEDIPAVGFYLVVFETHLHEFLRNMGCVDR
jgi:sacsin